MKTEIFLFLSIICITAQINTATAAPRKNYTEKDTIVKNGLLYDVEEDRPIVKIINPEITVPEKIYTEENSTIKDGLLYDNQTGLPADGIFRIPKHKYITVEGMVQEGLRQGKEIHYHNNGGYIHDEITYVNGIPTKYINFDHWGKGTVYHETYLVNGVPDGPSTTYWTSGKKEKQFQFLKGKITGMAYQYYSDGTLMSQCFMKNRKRYGTETKFYKSGKIKSETGPFNDEWLTGCSKTYYESGKLMFETYYENNWLDGTETEYYESGAVKSKIIYKHGVRQNIKSFYESGQLEGEWLFDQNGHNRDTVKLYYESGAIAGEAHYIGEYNPPSKELRQQTGRWTYERDGSTGRGTIKLYGLGLRALKIHNIMDLNPADKSGNLEGEYLYSKSEGKYGRGVITLYDNSGNMAGRIRHQPEYHPTQDKTVTSLFISYPPQIETSPHENKWVERQESIMNEGYSPFDKLREKYTLTQFHNYFNLLVDPKSPDYPNRARFPLQDGIRHEKDWEASPM